jgi:hypothetical protein
VVQRAAVVDRDGAGRPLEVDDLAHVDRGRFLRLQAPDPLALCRCTGRRPSRVAAREHAERPLIGGAVEEVGPGRAGAVVWCAARTGYPDATSPPSPPFDHL